MAVYMKARGVQCAAPVAVTRRVDRVDPDWPCDRALAAAHAAVDLTEPLQDAARDTTVQAVPDIAEPIDDEVATDADAPADEETTTVRPPLPELLLWDAAPASDARDRPAPSRNRIGKYELSTRLARGAFGVVYTARDPSLDRNVAIKVLRLSHRANPEIVQRFLQEARTTARIAHPGIVTIHDFGMVETRRGSTAFIAMELLPGESLSRRLARVGRLTPAAACELVRQVASALAAAHHVDVLHRDLKPDNIFLVPDPAMPSGERVKVLDFGLAKLGATGHTQAQVVFGTPRYMSPEQSRSATQIDHRSDIYSLGCILFELVTGRTPFDGDPRLLIERHQRATPPRAAALAPELPLVLDELIAVMLAKDPADRPQSMAAVQRVLRFAADGGTDDGPTAPQDPSASARVLPLPARPSTPPAGLAASAVRRPSSSPAPSRPSTHPRPSLPRMALPSAAPASSSVPGLRAIEPAPRPPSDLGRPGEGTSGEIIVPAVAARDAERSLAAAAVGWPELPDPRHRLVFYLLVVAIAMIAAVALAVA
jgi:serine/threonine protein kinase